MVLLEPSDMLAYLSMMAPRLIELRRVLKPTGSIYLHCDPTASHYLKLLLDAIFGAPAFLNEIIWHYQTSSGSPKKWLIRNHDTILRYAAGDPKTVKWNPLREPWPEATLKKWQTDEEGRIYRVQHKFNKRYYIDPAGKLADDVWELTLASRSHERLGYPTQKPLALLERIIQISSDEGDVVLDPFCGCGTAVDAAQRLNRGWVGIDITHLAVNLIRHRLRDAYGPEVEKTYRVIGEPTSIDDAKQLAHDDPYQFQWWALGLVGARPTEQKKGADKGIDGTLFFVDDPGVKPKRIMISVKAGKTGSAHVRDLHGVVDREGAAIGVLISMQTATSEMRKEAASGGFYSWRFPGEDEDRSYPKIQLLTIDELLSGKGIDYPAFGHQTFKKAPQAGVKDRHGNVVQHEALFD